MTKRAHSNAVSIEMPVRLNVGGRIFDVNVETINAFQYLQARLSENLAAAADDFELDAAAMASLASLDADERQALNPALIA